LNTLISMKQIMLAHGSGGEESNALLKTIFWKHFDDEILSRYEDSAVLNLDGLHAYTTDSFTVNPLFFNGGDIGKLSICGTCNDLAMMGAKPKYVSCGFIIEEGFSLEMLETIVISMKKELDINGAQIVTGDTKVVPKGSVDQLFINTSGVGSLCCHGVSSASLCVGDVIICSGYVGEHGAEIFSRREGIGIGGNLKSDCASLWPIVQILLHAGMTPHAMRDATRGGLAAVLNEWAMSSEVGICVEEDRIPVREAVRGICEMLGFEPCYLANEGMFVMALPKEQEKDALRILRSTDHGKNATYIGEVISAHLGKVILQSPWKTKRYLETPSGELLPRIC
jgi:hydrogenase expression/formation protein HypE